MAGKDRAAMNVTEFFRDPEVFHALKTSVFPELLSRRTPSAPIRVWVPGCSTGSGAYSIAIALVEFLEGRGVEAPIRIFGTDIGATALDEARLGVYPPSLAETVSPERLRRFFSPVDNGYRIGQLIRKLCVFAKHDLTEDPPFSRLDLVICRNVTIYFSPALRRSVAPIFHYALKPSGYLLLGPSKSMGAFRDWFVPYDKRNNIFTRAKVTKKITRRDRREMQSTRQELTAVNEELQTRNSQPVQTGGDAANLLSNLAVPIVVMDNNLRITRFTPVSEKILNLIPSDLGRPIGDVKFNIDIPNLRDLLSDVIESLSPKALEVRDWNGRRYLLRIRPYRAVDNRIDGAVMILVDMEMGLDLLGSGDPPGSLRSFTRRLIAAQEEERRKLSRELHDELNQKLALLELDVESLENKQPPADKVGDCLRSFRCRVSGLSDDIRRIAYQLHPSILDDLGLVVALESYCRDISDRGALQTSFHRQNVPSNPPADVALAIYRVAQEALRNVAKHAAAELAEVTLEGSPGYLQLTVSDTGRGFDPAAPRRGGGLGLTSIRERVHLLGGTVELASHPGDGTTLTVRIPLDQSPSQGDEENA